MVRPRHPLAVSLALASVLLLIGCGDHVPREAAWRDSAGIRIVVQGGDGTGRSLAPREVPLHGGGGEDPRDSLWSREDREPEGPPEFGRISAVDADPEGLLYVLDGTEGVVTVLDPPSGRMVRRFGGRGAGPGEFRSAADLQLAEDGSVLVGERIPLLIHRFDRSGRHLESVRLDLSAVPRERDVRSGRAAALAEWSAATGGDLIVRTLTLHGDPTRPGTNRLLRVGADGIPRTTILEWREPGTLADPPPLLSARRSWAAGADGRIHYTDGRDYEIRTLDRRGRLRRILRRSDPPRRVGPELRERALREFGASMREGGAPAAAVEAVTADLEVARHLPAIHGLWIDPVRGELWVGIPGGDDGRGQLAVVEYHLFDPEGLFLGRVPAPPGFRLHSVRARQMLGSHVDELGVHRPRVYRVDPDRGDRSGTSAP